MNAEEQALLEQLHDVTAPQQPGWWPPAIGWWVLMFLVVVTLAVLYFLHRKLKQRKLANQWRRDALAYHQRISYALTSRAEASVDQSAELAELSVLMRRVALALMPREQVAALTDDSWLKKLDDISGTREYSLGVGQSLSRAPYRRTQQIDQNELSQLLELTATTIQKAQPNHHVNTLESSVASV